MKHILNFGLLFSLIVVLFSWKSQAVESNRIWVELNSGESVHTATRSIELFVLRAGYGHHIIQNFDKYNPLRKRDTYDKIMFDYGSYSDIFTFGVLPANTTLMSRTASFYVEAVDLNADGAIDTRISVGNDSITILNCAPTELYGWQLMGG